MPKTRIVHVINGLRTGGAEMMLLKLLETMSTDEFEQSVVSLEHRGTLGPQIEALGIPVISLNMRGPRDFPRAVKELRSTFKKKSLMSFRAGFTMRILPRRSPPKCQPKLN